MTIINGGFKGGQEIDKAAIMHKILALKNDLVKIFPEVSNLDPNNPDSIKKIMKDLKQKFVFLPNLIKAATKKLPDLLPRTMQFMKEQAEKIQEKYDLKGGFSSFAKDQD